ncbi:MAG TPA: hypothetical protein ENK31_03225 [Nannocystis exedens]|nr:hypothetical protein [Nannocystis exedens]
MSGQWPEGAANPVVAAEAPGLEYDPVVDSLVAWAGGAPQVFSLASHSWTAMSAAGAPTEAVEAGTYGRFAYMATLNAYVLLNSVDDDVWIYKLTAGCAPE